MTTVLFKYTVLEEPTCSVFVDTARDAKSRHARRYTDYSNKNGTVDRGRVTERRYSAHKTIPQTAHDTKLWSSPAETPCKLRKERCTFEPPAIDGSSSHNALLFRLTLLRSVSSSDSMRLWSSSSICRAD